MNTTPRRHRKSVTSLFALSLLSAPLFAQQPPGEPNQTPPAGVEERQITFPTDGLVAPGTLTLPASPHANLPLLVMIGGSGVHNHNSVIGPHKILQQLAWGLAQHGIATLCFDRRPMFALSNFTAHFDLDHEVVIDAASALAYAATLPEIDPHKIYLLGHSLGADLAPDIVAMRLAQEPASVRGMLLMSGDARPFDVTYLEQVRIVGKARGGTPAQIDHLVASWTAVFDAARDPQTPASEPLGVGVIKAPAQYWRDWLGRNPVPGLQSLGLPALVLGGTSDLSPSHEGFEMLREAATASGSASLELPGLNHEYITVPGVGSTTFVAAQVAPAVLDTVAQWVATGHIDSKLP